MLGRDHALSGAAVFLGADIIYAHIQGQPLLPPAQLAMGAVVCSGFALLPDIDEPNSTVSRKLGPISRGVSKVCKRIAGGHRKATHCVLFVAAVFLAVWACSHNRLAVAIIVGSASALALRLILPKELSRQFSGLLMVAPIGIGVAVWYADPGGFWLPIAAAGGVLVHLLGDALTVEGVPFLWPMSTKMAVPLLGHTDSRRERFVGMLLMIAMFILLGLGVIRPMVNNLRDHRPINSPAQSMAVHELPKTTN